MPDLVGLKLARDRVLDSFGSGKLNLILLPTEACNFRCTYCYEDFELGQMTSRVVNGIIALIDSRASSLDNLEISWFGGEPLLALSVIRRIMNHARNVAGFHPGLTISSNITTNGYLL